MNLSKTDGSDQCQFPGYDTVLHKMLPLGETE